MSHQLLVIEADSTPVEASVWNALRGDPQFHCRRIAWDGLAPDALARPVDGVVAVAVPRSATVDNSFRWLLENPIAAPSFAVLSSDVEEGLLCSAAQSVDDFMLSPLHPPELRQRLSRLLGPPPSGVDAVREQLLEEMGRAQLIGRDPTFLQAIEQIPRFARSGMPVLITGETGTGKELCARFVHHLSPRRDFPFIPVDCGALPDQLIENELFGHARGAYTDANREQQGLVAMADGGTLFLDEVDALSPNAQGKLLRFLQERTFRPLGADRFVKVDVSVITATNRELEQCVAEKQFRADLYFRLNVLRLHLPPLRERRDDIPLLATHFLRERSRAGGGQPRTFSPAALRALISYAWPGNVRELSNLVHRATLNCDGTQLLANHFGVVAMRGGTDLPPSHFRVARAATIESFERRFVEDLLRKHRGNVTRAAREAEKDRRVFGRLIKKYAIDRHNC